MQIAANNQRQKFFPEPASWADVLISLIILAIFSVYGFFTINQYGLTWDEPENLVVGERFLYFFRTRDLSALEMSEVRPEIDNPDQLHLRLFESNNLPQFPNILAAISGRLFGRWTGWLDPVDARHMAIVIMGGIILGVTFLFTREAFNRWVAIYAVLVLFLLPRFIADIHYNLKDVPKTMFFLVCIWCFWRGFAFNKVPWILVGGLLLGIGLSIRPQIALVYLAIFLWSIANYRMWQNKQIVLAMLFVPGLAIIGFLLGFPKLLFFPPLEIIRNLFEFWKWNGFTDRQTWTLYPILMLLFTTPLNFLGFVYFGVVTSVFTWKFDEYKTTILLWVWLLLPVVRLSMPYSRVYDGIRIFLEVLPAWAIIAALGVEEIRWFFSKLFVRVKPNIMRIALLILFIPAIYEVFRFYPYEIAYFNLLVGGLPGAQEVGIQEATDYWGTSYRQGFDWINHHANIGSALYMPAGQRHIGETVRDIWIRQDINLITDKELVSGDVYVMHITRLGGYEKIDTYVETQMKPLYVILVDNASILKIFLLSSNEWVQANQSQEIK